MVALSRKDSFVSINRFCFQNENHVGKSLVIYQSSHVADQTGDCLVIDFILLKSPNIENADVVEPFTAIKASEDEELLCADHT